MPHDVTMPQLGMAQDAGRIVAWLKAPGDAVAKGDALFEVETDKATMEVEAQAGGYLTGVVAAEGDDVPVGQVIARISDSADDDAPPPAATPAPKADSADTLPAGKEITMPQLGMAQDSGQVVGWLVELGAQVGADDMLFEVETDKSTMEVPAGQSGYLAATLAQAGEDVAVGAAVAIISAEKPANTVARSATQAPKAPAAPVPDLAPKDTAPSRPAAATPAPLADQGSTGRILASPKARRLALEQGLDLGKLAAAGHPQPYHVADLDVLRNLPVEPAPQPGSAQSGLRLTAATAQSGLEDFTKWAADAHGLKDADALLAGLAGQGHAQVVAIERFGTTTAYALPDSRRLSQITTTDAAPDLILRDLRSSFVQSVALGAEPAPVLTLLAHGDGLSLVLECAPHHLSAPAAIALLNDVAGRMEQPLRHLL